MIALLIFAFWLGNEISEQYYATSDMLIALNAGLRQIYRDPLAFFRLSLAKADLQNGFLAMLPALMAAQMLFQNKKHFHRKGEEYGSARWGTADDFKPLCDHKNPRNNIILTATEQLNMDTRKTRLNNNVLVIGGSGSGKTRYFVKPNLMQLHSSYVITDPKGTLLIDEGQMFVDAGYAVKTFNTIDFEQSLHYNPLAYIKSEEDILKVVDVLISNTSGKGATHEDFWIKSERLLLTALIAYLYFEAPKEEQTFAMVSLLINESETREDDENYKNAVDILFEHLEERQPDHFAVLQYKKYKLAAGKTAKSILISVGVRLAPFDIPKVRALTAYDEMELDILGNQKTALFIIIPDTNATFNFLAAMLYSQMFDTLCHVADTSGGRLKIPVRCILDEFANIGQIPEFDKLIATIRSREISACIILQSLTQLKTMYEKSWETIVDNCDSLLFLGGRGESTTKMMSNTLGKETIDQMVINETRGRDRSSSLNYSVLGRELLTEAELKLLKPNQCILSVRTCPPFLSKKYDLTKHPNYRQTADYNSALAFDIQKQTEGGTLRPETILAAKQIVEFTISQ